MLRPRNNRKTIPSRAAAPNILILVVVSVASFFAGSLFSLQASIGDGGGGQQQHNNQQPEQHRCATEAALHALVANRVQEGAWRGFNGASSRDTILHLFLSKVILFVLAFWLCIVHCAGVYNNHPTINTNLNHSQSSSQTQIVRRS